MYLSQYENEILILFGVFGYCFIFGYMFVRDMIDMSKELEKIKKRENNED